MQLLFALSVSASAQSCPKDNSYGFGCQENCLLTGRFDASTFGKLRIPIKYFHSVDNDISAISAQFSPAIDSINAIFAYNGAPFEFYNAGVHAITEIDEKLCSYSVSTNCDCSNFGLQMYQDLTKMSDVSNDYPTTINFFLFEEYYRVYRDDNNVCVYATDSPAAAGYPFVSTNLATNYIIAENNLFDHLTEDKNVLAHEVGHILGLYHPWDVVDPNSPTGTTSTCTNYDRILDTPNDPDPDNTYNFNNLMEYGNPSDIETPYPLVTQCQRAKMIDVLYQCQNVFCFNPGTPQSLTLSNGAGPTTSFILGEIIFADCELHATNPSNTGGAALYSVTTPGGDKITYDFVKTLNLHTGPGTPFNATGTYNVCVKDAYPFNRNCTSSEICQNITLNNGSTGTSITFTNACTSSDPLFYFEDIYFHDMQTGWACGDGGRIYKTTNGGTSWTEVYDDNGTEINRIRFFNDMEGIAMRNGGDDIIKTYDGGASWTIVANPSGNLRDIDFYNSDIGFICGYSTGGGNTGATVLKTTDGGETWEEVMRQNDYQSMHDIEVVDADHIWTVGSLGKVYFSGDGGESWILMSNVGAFSTLRAVEFLDVNTGWIGDGSGRLYKTTNGGATWSQINTSGPSILQMHFFDQNLGYRVNNSSTSFQVTTDGGDTWTQITINKPSGVYGGLRRAFFLSTDVGWGVGFSHCHIVKMLNLGYEPCPRTAISLSNQHNVNREFEDHSVITSDAVIQNGLTVTYDATMEVILGAGFYTGTNTVFEILMNGCD